MAMCGTRTQGKRRKAKPDFDLSHLYESPTFGLHLTLLCLLPSIALCLRFESASHRTIERGFVWKHPAAIETVVKWWLLFRNTIKEWFQLGH